MSDVKDRYITEESQRLDAIKQQIFNIEQPKTEEEKAAVGGIEQTGPLTFSGAAWLASLVTMPLPTIMGTLGGEGLKKVAELAFPKHSGIQSGSELAGGIIGALLGDPTSRELLAEKAIESPEEKEKIIENVLGKVLKIANVGEEEPVPSRYKYRKLVEMLYDTLHSTQKPESVQIAEKEIGTRSMQSIIAEAAKESRERIYNLLKQRLKAAGIKEVDAKLSVMQKIYEKTGNITTAEINGLLLNPRISAQKLLTDVVNLPVQAIFKGIGVANEHGLAAGAKATMAQLVAYRETFKDALKLSFQTYKTVEPEFLKTIGVESKSGTYAMESAWDNSHEANMYRWTKAIHDVYAIGSKLIMSSDQFAKALAYRAELRGNAFYDGLNIGDQAGLVNAAKIRFAKLHMENLINEPPDWLHEKALENMHKLTFTENGKIISSVNQFINEFPLLKNAVPFFRTPANLIKQGLQFSPLGPLVSIKELTEGGLEQSAALAKWGFGSAIFYELSEQTAEGNITGDGPQGKGRELWPGRTHPRSIRIGDKWVSYAHLGPFAEYIALAADSTELYHASKDPASAQKLMDIGLQLFSNEAEHMPFAQESYNLFHALDAWKEGGSGKAAEEFAARSSTLFEPAPLRLAAQIEDPVMKQAKTYRDMIAENVPGWSKTVPPKRDIYGHMIYPPISSDPNGNHSKINMLLNEMNPIPVYKNIEPDNVDIELYRHKYNPKKVPDFWWKSGDYSVPLSPEQQDDFARYVGHESKMGGMNLHDRWAWLIEQPWYKQMKPDMQTKQLQAIHNGFLEMGRVYMMHKYPQLLQQEIQQRIQQATPIHSMEAAE